MIIPQQAAEHFAEQRSSMFSLGGLFGLFAEGLFQKVQ